jgi:hypothetical protein
MNKRDQQPGSNQLVSETDREMLRSILRKDNDRIKDEIHDAKTDVVFKLGFEGGGLEITRFTTAEGKEYFVTSGCYMTMDDNDDEDWISWKNEPTASFAGSLAELQMGTDMLCITPLVVHPDYRQTVREYVDKLLGQVTNEKRERMGDYIPANADGWFSRLRDHTGIRPQDDKDSKD